MALTFDLCFATNWKRYVLHTHSGERRKFSSRQLDLPGRALRRVHGSLRQDPQGVHGPERDHHRRTQQLQLHPS